MTLIIVFFTTLFVAACTGLAALLGSWLIGFVISDILVVAAFFILFTLVLRLIAEDPAYKAQQHRRRRGF